MSKPSLSFQEIYTRSMRGLPYGTPNYYPHWSPSNARPLQRGDIGFLNSQHQFITLFNVVNREDGCPTPAPSDQWLGELNRAIIPHVIQQRSFVHLEEKSSTEVSFALEILPGATPTTPGLAAKYSKEIEYGAILRTGDVSVEECWDADKFWTWAGQYATIWQDYIRNGPLAHTVNHTSEIHLIIGLTRTTSWNTISVKRAEHKETEMSIGVHAPPILTLDGSVSQKTITSLLKEVQFGPETIPVDAQFVSQLGLSYEDRQRLMHAACLEEGPGSDREEDAYRALRSLNPNGALDQAIFMKTIHISRIQVLNAQVEHKIRTARSLPRVLQGRLSSAGQHLQRSRFKAADSITDNNISAQGSGKSDPAADSELTSTDKDVLLTDKDKVSAYIEGLLLLEPQMNQTDMNIVTSDCDIERLCELYDKSRENKEESGPDLRQADMFRILNDLTPCVSVDEYGNAKLCFDVKKSQAMNAQRPILASSKPNLTRTISEATDLVNHSAITTLPSLRAALHITSKSVPTIVNLAADETDDEEYDEPKAKLL